jgi:hypothetical protein
MNETNLPHTSIGVPSLTEVARRKNLEARATKARVVVGGSIGSHDPGKPFLERMILGKSDDSFPQRTDEARYARAVLDSVAVNVEAGVGYLEDQENSLAEIGGKLSEIAAILTASRASYATESALNDFQVRFEQIRHGIREEALNTHQQAALFSEGTSPPVVVAVPTCGKWEGLAIDRANLGSPGMIAIETGKIHGTNSGLFLDEGSVQRALRDWRKLCLNNHLQWGMLTERLHRIKGRLCSADAGNHWTVPSSPESLAEDGLRRPHRDN